VQTAPNVRFEGKNGHDADMTRCLLMTHFEVIRQQKGPYRG